MQYALAIAALAAAASATPRAHPVAAPIPQGISASIAPSSTPLGCASTYNAGQPFQIGIVNTSDPFAGLTRRATNPNDLPGNSLMLSLQSGSLRDQSARKGYIASNNQLQFDPMIPQAGAKYTTGFSVCADGSLALASSTWWECRSGDFYNIYTDSTGGECYSAQISVIDHMGSFPAVTTASRAGPSATFPPLSQTMESLPVGSSAASPPGMSSPAIMSSQAVGSSVTAVSTQLATMSQITDGQVQAPTNGTTTPYNPNAAPAGAVSSGYVIAIMAGTVAFAAFSL